MANLFRRTDYRVDPVTGRKVAVQGKKWWGRYRDAEGTMRRVPLTLNKTLAQRMLVEILEKVELEKAGIVNPLEIEAAKPIQEHLRDFEVHLHAKNNEPRTIYESMTKIRRALEYCRWRRITDISETSVERFLCFLRREMLLSVCTSNHYLKVIKSFCNWLVERNRLVRTPLRSIHKLNERLDQRHHRRALSDEEFSRLIETTEHSEAAVGLTGPDRAMLYIFAAWTGFRRSELGSLTLRSFNLADSPAVVRITAACSKHRREDVQVMHPDLVQRFTQWVVTRRFPDSAMTGTTHEIFMQLQLRRTLADVPLFPILARNGGVEHQTADMMIHDLEQARVIWIDEAANDSERMSREESDFLRYRNSEGLFADFHGLRHTFISNLGCAGVSPKTAQILARHSDISLTMNIYTHVDQDAQVAALNLLPAIPGGRNDH